MITFKRPSFGLNLAVGLRATRVYRKSLVNCEPDAERLCPTQAQGVVAFVWLFFNEYQLLVNLHVKQCNYKQASKAVMLLKNVNDSLLQSATNPRPCLGTTASRNEYSLPLLMLFTSQTF